MKYHIMTDGYHIQVVNKWSLEYFESTGWVKVGLPFSDWKHANKHADNLALALG